MRSLRKTLKKLSPAIVVMSVFCGLIQGQTTLTTIQDTLFDADGARYNGTLTIEWGSFSTTTGTIVQQSRTVQIVNGNLLVQLSPNNTAAPPNNIYTVLYQSDGDQQYTETWSVPASTTPVRLSQIRTGSSNGGSAGGLTGSTGPFPESSITNLLSDLNARPVKGPAFGTSAVAVVDQNGQLETVVGSIGDCVFVDGSSGPCSGPSPTFFDTETPGGLIDGLNATFTLANAPTNSSLHLFLNGLLQQVGVDYTLTGSTVQFLPASIPQATDILVADYRVDGAGGNSGSGATGPSGAPGVNGCGAAGALSKSGSYQIVPGDNGSLFIQTSIAAFTLPVTLPPAGWCVALMNTSVSGISIGSNGNSLNRMTSGYVLGSANTITVVSDGLAYWASGATGAVGATGATGATGPGSSGTLAQRSYNLLMGGSGSGSGFGTGAFSPTPILNTGVSNTIMASVGNALVFSHSGTLSQAAWTWSVDPNWDNTIPVSVVLGGFDPAGAGGNFGFTVQIGCLISGGSRAVVFGTAGTATFTMGLAPNYYETTITSIDMSHCAAGQLGSVLVTRNNAVSSNSADDAAIARLTLNYSDK